MPTVTDRGNFSESEPPITMEDVQKEAKTIVEKVIKDVGKASATKQLVLGCTSGWLTGYLMMKVGKAAAVALGGGIILLQIANHNGYVKVNWDKLTKKADQIADGVEASASSKGSKLIDKVERFVDRKIEKVEKVIKKKEQKAKKWYHTTVLNDPNYFQFEAIHVFMASFIASFAAGVVFGRIV